MPESAGAPTDDQLIAARHAVLLVSGGHFEPFREIDEDTADAVVRAVLAALDEHEGTPFAERVARLKGLVASVGERNERIHGDPCENFECVDGRVPERAEDGRVIRGIDDKPFTVPCPSCSVPGEEKGGDVVTGVDLIAAERERQVSEEGWTPEHDDTHDSGQLAEAAACYAMPERLYVERRNARGASFVDPWPWADSWDKRKDGGNVPDAIPTKGAERIRMLARAGALIAAEIDRLQRLQGGAP